MSTITASASPDVLRKTGTNEPVAYTSYTTDAGVERVLYAQRVEGRVCLTDGPASGQRGRCYTVEDDLTAMAELEAIVADYLTQAELRGGIPARVAW